MPPKKKAACPANEFIVRSLLLLSSQRYSGQHMAKTLNRAAASVCKYPLPLTSAQDAMQLEHVGAWVADQIARILEGGGPPSPTPTPPVVPPAGDNHNDEPPTQPPKRRRQKEPTVATSGAAD